MLSPEEGVSELLSSSEGNTKLLGRNGAVLLEEGPQVWDCYWPFSDFVVRTSSVPATVPGLD